MFVYDSSDESIDPMVEGYDSDIAAENRKRIRRNYERKSNVLRQVEYEESSVTPYTESDVQASLHVPLPTKRRKTFYDNVLYQTQRENQRVENITRQLRAREAHFAVLEGQVKANQQARMLKELEEYGLAQNEIYKQRADEKKARLAKAMRLKNEYTLRQHFINVLNTK